MCDDYSFIYLLACLTFLGGAESDSSPDYEARKGFFRRVFEYSVLPCQLPIEHLVIEKLRPRSHAHMCYTEFGLICHFWPKGACVCSLRHRRRLCETL